MKKFRYLMICLAAILTGLYFVSCSSDDDDNKGGIVGTWALTETSDSDKSYAMFCSDGTCYAFSKYNGKLDFVRKYKYIYSAEQKKVKLIDGSFDVTMEVVSLEGNTLILSTGSGYPDTFKKASSPYSITELENFLKISDSYSHSY